MHAKRAIPRTRTAPHVSNPVADGKLVSRKNTASGCRDSGRIAYRAGDPGVGPGLQLDVHDVQTHSATNISTIAPRPAGPGPATACGANIPELPEHREVAVQAMRILAIVLIVVGLLGLAYEGITYTKREKVLEVGPITATKETKKTIPLPPVLGGAALVCGVVLLIASARP